MYELLKLRPDRARTTGRNCRYPKASTKTDWCAKNEGPVTGVVDFELQGLVGEVLRIWGGEGRRGRAVPAMQVCRQMQDVWLVGFVADKAYLHLVEAQERHSRVTVNILKYAMDNLLQVLSFVEQLVIAVDGVQFPPAIGELTLTESSSDSDDDMRERVGRLEAEVKALKKEVKGIAETLTQVAKRGCFD